MAKRLIDATDAAEWAGKHILDAEERYTILDFLRECSTVDAVEVVRCRDCKWYQEGELLAPNRFCFRLKHPEEDRKIGYNYAPDDFCSYGKRKEG